MNAKITTICTTNLQQAEFRVMGAVFPDKLIITDDGVIYRKGRVIGYKEIKIRHSAIGSVSLDKHLLFADIVIETNGGQRITARGFSRSDANMIRNLLD